MRKTCKKVIALALGLALFIPIGISGTKVQGAEDIIEEYNYKVTAEDPAWLNMSLEEKRESLVIPEEDLAKMTDKCLYDTLKKYPFLCDLLAFATNPTGPDEYALEKFKENCSVYQEIERRGLTVTELARNYGNKISTRAIDTSDIDEDFISNMYLEELEKVEKETMAVN